VLLFSRAFAARLALRNWTARGALPWRDGWSDIRVVQSPPRPY
jgi:hypothetical protein